MKHTRFRIRVPLLGKLYIFINIGIGFAAINTGNNLLYLVFGAMLGFLILSGVLSNITLLHIQVSAFAFEDVYAGQPTALRLHFENKKRWLPSYAITCRPLETQTVFSQASGVFEEMIPPQRSTDQTFLATFDQRGWATLPPFYIETLYPFGLLKKYLLISPKLDVLVFPKLLDVPWEVDQAQLSFGATLSTIQVQSSTNPYGIREFRQGDSYRHVHWKSSAKRGDLHIKEFEGEQMPFIYLQLLLAPESRLEAQDERAISMTASILKHYTDHGYIVHLITSEATLRNMTTENRREAFAHLATLDPKRLRPMEVSPMLKPLIVVSNLDRQRLSGTNAQRIVSSFDTWS